MIVSVTTFAKSVDMRHQIFRDCNSMGNCIHLKSLSNPRFWFPKKALHWRKREAAASSESERLDCFVWDMEQFSHLTVHFAWKALGYLFGCHGKSLKHYLRYEAILHLTQALCEQIVGPYFWVALHPSVMYRHRGRYHAFRSSFAASSSSSSFSYQKAVCSV